MGGAGMRYGRFKAPRIVISSVHQRRWNLQPVVRRYKELQVAVTSCFIETDDLLTILRGRPCFVWGTTVFLQIP